MSPVSPAEIRFVDEQLDRLQENVNRYPPQSTAVVVLVRVVRMIWEVLKREHGWR